MVIDKISKLTKILYPLRKLSFLLVLLFIVSLFYAFAFLPPTEQDRYTVPSLLGLLWVMLFNLLLASFHTVPVHQENKTGYWQRVKISLLRFFYALFALFFIGLTLLVIFLSFRMLNS